MAAFKKGDEVFVFYRMSKRCSPARKYLAGIDARHGAYRPRLGVSDGWLPAKVAVEPEANAQAISIEYNWPHFFTMRGHVAKNDGWTEMYPVQHIRKASEFGATGPLLFPPLWIPELAIVTFRWGGVNEVIAPAQWGFTGSSVSDIFVNSFVDMAVEQHLGQRYEVWTVYIENQYDMLKIAQSAHLIFGAHHPVRRAKNVCAMYHLYPTAFEENCIPTQETGEDGGAALVDQKSFFRMMQAVERAGIPTRFPHPSGLYELLASKRWTYYMSLVPHLRVPPTVSVPRMLIEAGNGSCERAAQRAYEALSEVRRQQYVIRGETPPTDSLMKGVAKLGFSWEALDVKFWQGGQSGLEAALYQLTQAIEISGEVTGQPHDLEAIIVQEYIPHDLEMRLYYVEGNVEAIVYTKFCKIKENLEFGDFHESFSHDDAARQWMGGDSPALKDGERRCREISSHWLQFLQAQCCEMPAAIRFDFFVRRNASKPGEAEVWTLEICELGFSMLGAKQLPAKVFPAMLRSMLGGKDKVPESLASKALNETPEPMVTNSPAEEPTADSEAGVPAVLYITVPKTSSGTKDQHLCTGKYEVMPQIRPGGFPAWIHSSGNRFLFHCEGCWYVGDEEEQEQNFTTDSGYIRHEGQGDRMPDALEGPWERGPQWDPEVGIIVSSNPDAKPSVAKATSKASGKGKNGKGKWK